MLLALNIDVVVPFVERLFGVQFLDKTIYYISDAALGPAGAATCSRSPSIALVLALVATLYPAWKASRVNPAEALRYE